jgi:Na+:H+ antiporter, NhaA family
MNASKLFTDFFNSEKSGGVLLIFCTIISLGVANSPWSEQYLSVWDFGIAHHSVGHWINDGLMTVFFLLIGLELEREIYAGELSTLKQAALPAVAALGGMIVPAGIFLALNFGLASQAGAGIPMATDIAFAIGILSLLGNRVPLSLKVLLTALAVIDDLGAIIIIAVFYTNTFSLAHLAIALGIMGFLFILNRFKIYNLIPYLIGGIFMWYFMLLSGVHATIAGVLLAFVIPFGDGSDRSPSYKLQHYLHKPVAFIILPLFALANTCILIEPTWMTGLMSANSIGIFAGLVFGKPLGIFLFSFAAVAAGMCTLPSEINWKHVIGVGLLGGIGFTMSIFITLLAFAEPEFVTQSKIVILLASVVSGSLGFVWLNRFLVKQDINP